MKEQRPIQDKEIEKCQSSARSLDWESGIIGSIDDAVRECGNVDICDFNSKCRLKEAYLFHLNEQYRRDKDIE